MSEQVNALDQFRKPFSNPCSQTYNPNWQNHPNFSWSQSQHNQVGSPGFNQFHSPNQPIYYAPLPTLHMVAPPQQRSNLEVMIEKSITGTIINMQDLKVVSLQSTKVNSQLQYQMVQLATKIREN